MFTRYHIKTKVAPPRSPQPSKFVVKVDRLKFVRMIAGELKESSSLSEMKGTIKSRPCLYGVYSRPVGGLAPKSSSCVACYRCVIENPGMVRILPNPDLIEKAQQSGLTPKQISTLWYEAATGRVPVKGAGYNGPFSGPGFDAIWTDMSEIVRPTRDGIHGREYISTAVEIGSRPAFVQFDNPGVSGSDNLVHLPIPMLFDATAIPLPYFQRAAAATARQLATLVFVPAAAAGLPGDGRNIIPLVSISDLEKKSDFFKGFKLLEILCNSVDEYRKVKQATGKMIIARLAITLGIEKLITELLREKVEAIHFSPELPGANGTQPALLRDTLRSVHRILVQERKRDQVTVIAGGAITAAEHVPKAIICGADAVALDLPLVVALQGEFRSGENGRPAGVHLPEFDDDWARQRLVNLVGSWHAQLLEILGAMGLREVRRLRGEMGRAMFAEELEKEFCELFCRSDG